MGAGGVIGAANDNRKMAKKSKAKKGASKGRPRSTDTPYYKSQMSKKAQSASDSLMGRVRSAAKTGMNVVRNLTGSGERKKLFGG